MQIPAVDSASSTARGLRRLLLVATQVGVTGAALGWALSRTDLAATGGQLAQLDPRWAAPVLMLGLAQMAAWARRWQCVVHAVSGRHEPASGAFRWNSLSYLAGLFLPSVVLGDVVRINALRRHVGWAASLRSAVADRVAGLTALSLLCVGAAGLLWLAGLLSLALMLPALMALGCVVAVACAAMLPWLPAFGRVALPRALAVTVADLHRGLLHGRGRQVLPLSVAIHLMSLAQALMLALGLGLRVSEVSLLLAVLVIVFMVAALPVSIGGWGVREGAMVVGLAQLGVAPEAALALSVAYGTTGVVVAAGCSLAGCAWARRSGRAA